MYEYLTTSGKLDILKKPLPWLDDDGESILYEHFLKALEYYIAPENIGEHGLCKIRGGDWLDAVNEAGLSGRGESVTISCQTIINLGYAREIVSAFAPDATVCERFEKEAKRLREAVRTHALNKKDFVNSVFTDGGFWLFSDNDPDGECRPYSLANYFAVAAGIFNADELPRLWKNIDTLKCESGYRLFTPGFSKKPLGSVGRIASGDVPCGLWENGTVYNHGSQGFLLRALARAGEGDKMREVMRYLLPYDQEAHPPEKTKTMPYAIVNCYQDLPLNRQRGGMTFLTGTTAMAVRAVYDWIFGIRPALNGLYIKPNFPKGPVSKEACLTLRGKKLTVRCTGNNAGIFEIMFNGKKPDADFVSYELFKGENLLEIRYM